MNNQFRISSLLSGRLTEHKIELPALLRLAGLPPGFFQQSTVELSEAAFLLGYEDANSLRLAPGATLLEGQAFRGHAVKDARNDVLKWLREIKLLK